LSKPQNTKYFKCISNTVFQIPCISITPTLLIMHQALFRSMSCIA